MYWEKYIRLKRSHEPIYYTDTKNEAKRLRAILKKLTIWWCPKNDFTFWVHQYYTYAYWICGNIYPVYASG